MMLLPFVAELGVYPFHKSRPPRFEIYEGEPVGLRLLIEPIDRVGGLRMTIRMTDYHEPEIHLQALLPLTYATIQCLAEGLQEIGEARSDSFRIELI